MMLTELTIVPAASLPIEALKDHLRLGAGFALPAGQDGLLESYLRAALAAIEGRIGKALIRRGFAWSIEDWRDEEGQALPIAPVSSIASVTLFSAAGTPTVVPSTAYVLATDLHRPRVVGVGSTLPQVPTGGRVVIAFDAGFGPFWNDVPADLRQAVLLLAAEFYEHRHDNGTEAKGLPFAVVSLIERWRQVRVLGGRGRT